MRLRRTLTVGLLLLGLAHARLEAASAATKPAGGRIRNAPGDISYEKQITPLFEKYCYNCHGNGKKKGDLALDAYRAPADAVNDPKTWEKILQNVRSHVMPPEKKPQPSVEEAELITRWIQTQ